MKIVCPNCQTDYTLPESIVGPQGKKVKCARCATVWRATPMQDDLVEADDLADIADIANIGGGMERTVGDQAARDAAYAALTEDAQDDYLSESDLADEDEEDGTEDAIASGPVETAGGAPGARKHRRVRLKGGRGGPSPLAKAIRQAVRIGTPVAIAAGLVLLVLAIPLRDHMVRAVPDFARLYEMVGLEVNVRGIAFYDVSAERSVVAGLTVLKIEAAMRNVEDRTVSLAPVRMALIGEDGTELFTWRVDPSVQSLEPGETSAIVSELTAPPPNVTTIAVRFLQPGERLPAQIL